MDRGNAQPRKVSHGLRAGVPLGNGAGTWTIEILLIGVDKTMVRTYAELKKLEQALVLYRKEFQVFEKRMRTTTPDIVRTGAERTP